MTSGRTLFDKLWERAVVVPETGDHPALLFVDLHVLHEVTSHHAFEELKKRGWKVAYPDRALAITDHAVPTSPRTVDSRWSFSNRANEKSVELLKKNCAEHGIRVFDLENDLQGIVHVVVPELGLTWPGSVVVCGDSHTSTQGAYGALAFGIGSSEVAGVLSTQTLLMKKPRSLKVELKGASLPHGVTAKDIALKILATIGVGGAQGGVIEFTGTALAYLSMEERMTLCNQSVEAGARTALIAPDEITWADLVGRQGIPKGDAFEKFSSEWLKLKSDPEAHFDAHWVVDVSSLTPRITYGTLPALSVSVTDPLPMDAPEGCHPSVWLEGMEYMGLRGGDHLSDRAVQHVFIGSCTNGRLSDLRAAALVLKGKKIAEGVKLWVVPGSRSVKRAAEREGLDEVFKQAGAQWREPGCSLCVAMNGDFIPAGEWCVSTSNRNFAHRQGPGSRTLLASPLTAAATALRGRLTDPREVLPS